MKREHVEPEAAVQDLLRMRPSGHSLTIGIDPGTTGAIAVLVNGTTLQTVFDMPVLVLERRSNRKGKAAVSRQTQLDVHALLRVFHLFHTVPCTAYLERTTPQGRAAGGGDTAMTAFSMGLTRGILLASLAGCDIASVDVVPAVWKRYMGLLKQDKDASRIAAIRRFPALAKYLGAKGDHNRAEALLLAAYGQEKRKEQQCQAQ